MTLFLKRVLLGCLLLSSALYAAKGQNIWAIQDARLTAAALDYNDAPFFRKSAAREKVLAIAKSRRITKRCRQTAAAIIRQPDYETRTEIGYGIFAIKLVASLVFAEYKEYSAGCLAALVSLGGFSYGTNNFAQMCKAEELAREICPAHFYKVKR